MPPLIPKTPPLPPLCHSRSCCPLCIRPDETTKNHYGATSKDADETIELPSAVAATTGGGRQQGLVRGATATKDMNNTAKTAGQGGFTLLSLPKGADNKKNASAGLVQVRLTSIEGERGVGGGGRERRVGRSARLGRTW